MVDCILLIDDDKPTNFLNRKILSRFDCFKKIQVVQSGKLALEYLKNVETNNVNKPNIIFLDINMPAMNGWEFLKEYVKLKPSITNGIKIFLVTTSSSPKDIEGAKSNNLVNGLIRKPLSISKIDGILKRHLC